MGKRAIIQHGLGYALGGNRYLGFVAAGRRWDVASIGVTRPGSGFNQGRKDGAHGKTNTITFQQLVG